MYVNLFFRPPIFIWASTFDIKLSVGADSLFDKSDTYQSYIFNVSGNNVLRDVKNGCTSTTLTFSQSYQAAYAMDRM